MPHAALKAVIEDRNTIAGLEHALELGRTHSDRVRDVADGPGKTELAGQHAAGGFQLPQFTLAQRCAADGVELRGMQDVAQEVERLRFSVQQADTFAKR